MARRARTSIKRHLLEASLNVWDQKDHLINLAIMFADMMTIVYRMLGYKYLVLSPQILIDRRCTKVFDAKEIVTNPELGLQPIHDYPFLYTRTLYDTIEYQRGSRYCLDNLKIIANDLPKMKRAIQYNFSEKGKNHPLGAGLKMGDFNNAAVALAACKKPFRHPLGKRNYLEKLNAEPTHMLLIVHANFSSEDEREHYCLVKNSAGEEWGDKGFSKIVVDMLKVLCVPVLLEEKICCVKWKEGRMYGIPPENKKRRVN